MQELQLYIEGQRVELFKDESVSLTQSIQNVKDISKIFTDFSKTFSLPASKINSKIFKHYYNNDIVGGFDARKKKPANIELNNLPYKSGFIKLEGVDLKNNVPHTYRVTFFGSTVSLKDILGEEKLQSLDLSANDTVYTAGNIRTSLQLDPTSNDLITPLITHTQRLHYNSHSSDYTDGNLHYKTGHIKGVTWSDLKFSLRVDTILQAITAKHSELVFSDDFFVSTNAPYYNLFMWLHRKKGSVENFTGVNQVLINGWSTTTYDATETRMYTPTILQVAGTPSEYSLFKLSLSTASTALYTAVVQKDGVEVYRETASSGGNLIINSITPEVGAYTVLIETSSDITFSQIEWDITYRPSGGVFQSVNYPTGVFDLVSQFDFIISQQIPEMKTIDFLSGLFKMFNLTAYVDDATGKIVVKTLDSYYAAGSSYDVSKYIDVSKSSSNVALPYREINFQYEGVKTLLSAKFSQLSGKDWAKSSFDGGEKLDGNIYNIKLPFEHLQYERLNDVLTTSLTDVQYGFFVDKYKEEPNVENVGDPYINKPLLFYPIRQTSATAISFVFNSTAINSITAYNIPSNSVSLDSAVSKANINFHNETNEYERTNNFTDTLFNVYYKKYISDVFTESNRITKLTAHLPLGITLKLNLNDRLIVNGKSYKINSITTNLNNGKSQLELLNEV
tara:strand:+ start:1949 stop:3979 length:2031 start_codon:yes stop_codon:yes gene_type:complete